MAYMSTEHAKEIRKKIKKAFPAKDGWKFSIRKRDSSEISVTILQAPLDLDTGEVNQYHIPSEIGSGVYKAILEIMDAGNHDNSDTMTDYFDVGWYMTLRVGSWDKDFVYVDNGKGAEYLEKYPNVNKYGEEIGDNPYLDLDAGFASSKNHGYYRGARYNGSFWAVKETKEGATVYEFEESSHFRTWNQYDEDRWVLSQKEISRLPESFEELVTALEGEDLPDLEISEEIEAEQATDDPVETEDVEILEVTESEAGGESSDTVDRLQGEAEFFAWMQDLHDENGRKVQTARIIPLHR